MRIGIIGAHYVGKTTLARKLSDSFGWPIINEQMRYVLQKYKSISFTDLESIKKSTWYHEYVFDLICAQIDEENKYEDSFISDRTVLDYYIYFTSLARKDSGAERIIKTYVHRHTKNNYDVLLYIPIRFELNGDKLRNEDTEFRNKIDKVYREISKGYDNIYTINAFDIEDRVIEAQNIILNTYKTKGVLKNSVSKSIYNATIEAAYTPVTLLLVNRYNKLAGTVPKEDITFDEFGEEICVGCELICAAICNSINWSFLRSIIYERTLNNKNWLHPINLSRISEEDVFGMLVSYKKPDNIMAKSRANMLREVGKLVCERNGSYTSLFKNSDGIIKTKREIEDLFFNTITFGTDPQKKKYNLLLQHISDIVGYSELSYFCEPAIDYHLIRLFLRRGLVKARTKEGKRFIEETGIVHKECTTAAIRKRCAEAIETLAWMTSLDVKVINQIEWWIGRSVCTHKPDCSLSAADAKWLKSEYDVCPYHETCMAYTHLDDYLQILEPQYNGSSY